MKQKSEYSKRVASHKEATLNFTNGFNVLCGETGAGKSIIIKALDSVLGAKISKEVVLDLGFVEIESGRRFWGFENYRYICKVLTGR